MNGAPGSCASMRRCSLSAKCCAPLGRSQQHQRTDVERVLRGLEQEDGQVDDGEVGTSISLEGWWRSQSSCARLDRAIHFPAVLMSERSADPSHQRAGLDMDFRDARPALLGVHRIVMMAVFISSAPASSVTEAASSTARRTELVELRSDVMTMVFVYASKMCSSSAVSSRPDRAQRHQRQPARRATTSPRCWRAATSAATWSRSGWRGRAGVWRVHGQGGQRRRHRRRPRA